MLLVITNCIMEVHIQVLDHGINFPIASYSTDHSAGIDLRAAIDGDTKHLRWC